MKHGDFTALAKEYVNRPGYSQHVLKMIGRTAGMDRRDFLVADVGAGTGKLTEELAALGCSGYAVEPNDAMRAEGGENPLAQGQVRLAKGICRAYGVAKQHF